MMVSLAASFCCFILVCCRAGEAANASGSVDLFGMTSLTAFPEATIDKAATLQSSTGASLVKCSLDCKLQSDCIGFYFRLTAGACRLLRRLALPSNDRDIFYIDQAATAAYLSATTSQLTTSQPATNYPTATSTTTRLPTTTLPTTSQPITTQSKTTLPTTNLPTTTQQTTTITLSFGTTQLITSVSTKAATNTSFDRVNGHVTPTVQALHDSKAVAEIAAATERSGSPGVVSLRKPAKQSTSSPNNPLSCCGPEYVFDGDMTTYAVTQDAPYQWIAVDLKEKYNVSTITVTAVKAANDAHGAHDYDLRVGWSFSPDSVFFNGLLCSHFTGKMGGSNSVNFTCPKYTIGRYVSLQVTLAEPNKNNLYLAEMTVYGTEWDD